MSNPKRPCLFCELAAEGCIASDDHGNPRAFNKKGGENGDRFSSTGGENSDDTLVFAHKDCVEEKSLVVASKGRTGALCVKREGAERIFLLRRRGRGRFRRLEIKSGVRLREERIRKLKCTAESKTHSAGHRREHLEFIWSGCGGLGNGRLIRSRQSI